jgi:Spy/CpxP family protein refolding chaperone
MGLVLTGDFDGAKAAFKSGISEIGGIGAEVERKTKETAEKVEAIWAGTASTIAGSDKAPRALGGGAGSGGKAGKFEMDPRILEENFIQEQLRKIREKMDDERLRAEAAYERNVMKLRAAGQKNDARIEKEITQNREEEMRARTQMILDEVRLKKATAEAEKQMRMEVANAALGLAGQLFGESKELAIAGAVINTYEGATKALAQGGIYGPILAAIVIASGLAQVAKIASTNPTTEGAGFDDPANDAAARMGGRRWAADMIGEFTKGVSSGWAAGMGGIGVGSSTTTNDNRRTFNVHVHGAGLIDPANVQMAKQFKRTLDLIDTQYEGQRSIARRRP